MIDQDYFDSDKPREDLNDYLPSSQPRRATFTSDDDELGKPLYGFCASGRHELSGMNKDGYGRCRACHRLAVSHSREKNKPPKGRGNGPVGPFRHKTQAAKYLCKKGVALLVAGDETGMQHRLDGWARGKRACVVCTKTPTGDLEL
jgi:hypothetical protein